MFGTVHLPKPNNQQLTIQMVWFREMNPISIQSVYYILLGIDKGGKKKEKHFSPVKENIDIMQYL